LSIQPQIFQGCSDHTIKLIYIFRASFFYAIDISDKHLRGHSGRDR